MQAAPHPSDRDIVASLEEFIPPFREMVEAFPPVCRLLSHRQQELETFALSAKLLAHTLDKELARIENPAGGQLIDLADYARGKAPS